MKKMMDYRIPGHTQLDMMQEMHQRDDEYPFYGRGPHGRDERYFPGRESRHEEYFFGGHRKHKGPPGKRPWRRLGAEDSAPGFFETIFNSCFPPPKRRRTAAELLAARKRPRDPPV